MREAVRRRPSARIELRLAAVLSLLWLVLLPFGCGLTTSGIPTAGGCQKGGDAAQCQTPDPCMRASCNAEACGERTPLPDGDAASQTPGDCQKATCEAGATVQVADLADFED